jgi:4-amino-4-deoxy-L-arabinose transferase-like glycosyltransferase
MLLGVTVLTGAYRLMAQGPWGDEVYMLSCASSGFVEGLRHQLSTNMLPLHPALLWVFTLGGASLLGGRVLSLLAFYGAAWCLYRSADRLVGRRAALFALAIFSVNPLMVWHAQDARPYMLLVFLCVASLWMLTRVLASERGGLPGLFGCVLGGLLTHVYFAGFAAAMGLHVLLRRGEPGARRAALTLCGAGLAASPVVIALVLLSRRADAGWAKSVDVHTLAYTMLTFGTGYAFGATSEELHGPDPMAAMRPYLPAAGACLVAFWGVLAFGALLLFRRDRRRFLVLSGYAGLPLLLPLAAALASRTIAFNVRYVLPVAAMSLLFVACACAQAGRRLAPVAALLALSVELRGLASHYFDPRYRREDYAAVARLLSEAARAEDVILEGPAPSMLIFMLKGREVDLLPMGGTLDAPPRPGAHTFYVINRPWASDPGSRLSARLGREPGVRRMEVPGFVIFVR